MTGAALSPGVQVLPSVVAEEALAVLDELLRDRVPRDPNDAFFERDWSALWDELAAGGWTSFADAGEFSLLDLAAVAELWGGHLVPLPLTATLAVRRHLDDRPDPATRLSFVADESGTGLIAHGESVAMVATGAGLVARDSLGLAASLDRWAASLPISTLGSNAPATAALCRDGAVLAAAEAVGAAAMVLHRTVEYAKLREQFGRPIGSFQAVKHRLANMHCALELSRGALVWCCVEPGAVANATRAVLEHCLRVAEGCVQVHGGIGYTWEAAVHRYYRHIMSLRRLTVTAAGTV